MGTHSTRGAARLVAVLTGFALLAAVPIALAADASGLRSHAAQSETAQLPPAPARSRRADAATLSCTRWKASFAAHKGNPRLRARGPRSPGPSRHREAARNRQGAVRVSQSQLEVLVRALYERPDQGDPLAVLLNSESLDEALAGLDSLTRAAGQNNRIIEQAREARKQLGALDARLAEQAGELDALAAAAEQRAARLAATASARRSFIGGLRHQQGLDAARIAAIEARARTAEEKTAAIAPSTQPPGRKSPRPSTPLSSPIRSR